MLTLVMVEEVPEEGNEAESEFGQTEVALWHYFVPCAGVRYYCYDQALSPVKDRDPWALNEITMII
ncbi:MAG: hypothetical protein BZY75_06265 [SAR202 cluster bacterium Io17-Chloro-G7]|nr:MAG: hypothetical protein BZY75_06265 [SAR202 cluster bacterium Io17-Chloro-G7]